MVILAVEKPRVKDVVKLLKLLVVLGILICSLPPLAADASAEGPDLTKGPVLDAPGDKNSLSLTALDMAPVRSATTGTGGYVLVDSNDSAGPTYTFDDITPVSTSLALSDDEMSSSLPLGFDFDFFGETYSRLYVCANGFVTFLPDQPCSHVSAAAPTGDTPNGLIAAWWEDLDPGAGGSIQYAVLGTAPAQRFIVQFTDVPHYVRSGSESTYRPVTFQIILFEATGEIEVRYQNAAKENNDHLAGIEDAAGANGLTYYYGSNKKLTNLAVRYWHPGITVAMAADTQHPKPGDNIALSIVVHNTTDAQLSDIAVSYALPQSLIFAGPVSLTPGQPAATLAASAGDLPALAGNVTITAHDAVTLTVPLLVDSTAAGGEILNSATASGSVGFADTADLIVTVDLCAAQIEGNATPYTTVQDAIDAAQPGDVVRISGYCTVSDTREGVTQIGHIEQEITLRGGYSEDFNSWDPATHPTTLDACYEGRGLYITESVSCTLEHLRITHGTAEKLGGDLFDDDAGGGIYAKEATLQIHDCEIAANTAGSAGWGGGIFLRESEGTLEDNLIQGNTAWGGGGIELDNCSDIDISNNRILENTASYTGGGMFLYFSEAQLLDNIIRSNKSNRGGGITIRDDYNGKNPELVNTLIVDNQASEQAAAIYIEDASPEFTHTTIAGCSDNPMTGIRVCSRNDTSDPALINTILANHAVGIEVTTGNTARMIRTLWGDEVTRSGTITTEEDLLGTPDFVDADAGDYHLKTTSAALDAAISTTALTDIDGDTRGCALPSLNPPDIGVDENTSHVVERAAASLLTFGAAEAAMSFNDLGDMQWITVTLVLDYPTSQTANRPLPRHYIIHADNSQPFSGQMQFSYTQEEFEASGIADESTLQAYREVNGSWVAMPSSVDTDNNILTITGVTAFSRWAIGAPGHEPLAPTAVTLTSLSGTAGNPAGVELLLMALASIGVIPQLRKPEA